MQSKIQNESKEFSEHLKKLKFLQQQVEEKDKELIKEKDHTPVEIPLKKDSINYALEFKEQVFNFNLILGKSIF